MYPNINAERARRGWSLDEFATKMGVTRKTIYSWFKKGKIPSEKLNRMAELFDCSVDYLVGIETEKTTAKVS